MLFHAIRAELMKCRRAPVWLAFMVLPLFPAVLGTANYLGNLGVLQEQWYSLWTQHTLFASFFFLPALLGVFCAWQWRLEYSDHNFNSFLTAPLPVWVLYLAKLIPSLGVACLSQIVTGILFVVSGKLIGLTDPIPPQLTEWILCGVLGSMAVCAVQLFISLLLRSFAIPVAIGLLGGIAGMMLTTQGYGLYFPYSLLSLGMRANNPMMEIQEPVLVLLSLVYILLFALLTIWLLQKRDVVGE